MIMKKSYFVLLLLLLSCGSNEEAWHEQVVINDVTAADFDDPLFYRYMQVNYDKNEDKIFQKNEILAVKSLLIQEQIYLTSLKGLEKFVALEKLHIGFIKPDEENVKISNPRLQILTISTIAGMLDVTELSELQVLKRPGGLSDSLDLRNNTKLRELTCGGRGTLDLSNNPEIEKLECPIAL